MDRDVALIGFRRPPPGCARRGFVSLPMDAALTRKLGGFDRIVLGRVAVEGVDPVRAAGHLARFDGRVLLCPEGAAARTVLSWADAGFRAFVEPHEVRAAVTSRRRAPERPATPRHDWAGGSVVPGSPDDALLSALERTESLTVEEWAIRSGCSERTILRRCRKAFGAGAHKVAARYREFLDRVWRAAGISARDRAAGLGLADEFGVWRVARRGRKALVEWNQDAVQTLALSGNDCLYFEEWSKAVHPRV